MSNMLPSVSVIRLRKESLPITNTYITPVCKETEKSFVQTFVLNSYIVWLLLQTGVDVNT